MAEISRAQRLLAEILRLFPEPDEANGQARLIDLWAEGPNVICVVYEGWWFPGTLGLRRRLEPHLEDWQELANILDGELGEPVGTPVEGVLADEEGITWWEGDRPEWRSYR